MPVKSVLPLGKLRLSHLIAGLVVLLISIEGIGRVYDHYHQKKVYSSGILAAEREFVTYQDRTYPVRKPADTYRVLVLGGSAAAGHGSQDQESWARLVENKLAEHLKESGQTAEVINMAGGANISLDDYVNLVKDGLPLDPDLVIVQQGWNDAMSFASNPGWVVRHTESRLSEINKGIEDYDVWVRLRRRAFLVRKYFQLKEDLEESISSFYGFLRALRSETAARLEKYVHLPDPASLSVPSSEQQLTFEELLLQTDSAVDRLYLYSAHRSRIRRLFKTYYTANLRNLASALAAHKIQALFVFQPALSFESASRELSAEDIAIIKRIVGNRSGDWIPAVREIFPEGIRQMEIAARENNFGFADINRVMPAGGASRNYFMDDVHYTPEGNRFIADQIWQALIKQGILPKGEPRAV